MMGSRAGGGFGRAIRRAPRERSGASGVPASDRVRGFGGRSPPTNNEPPPPPPPSPEELEAQREMDALTDADYMFRDDGE
jgi:hypothetical protein